MPVDPSKKQRKGEAPASPPPPRRTSPQEAPAFYDPFAQHVTETGAQLLPLPGNNRYMLRFHPDQWEVALIEGEPYLVPQLSGEPLVPSVNGVHMAGKAGGKVIRPGPQQWAERLRGQASNGWRYLSDELPVTEPDHLPPGVAPGGILRKTPTQLQGRSGVYHHEPWVTFERNIAGNYVEQHHHGPRLRWLRDMVDQGLFGQPSARCLRAMRQTLARKESSLAGQPGISDAFRAQASQRIERETKALETAIARFDRAEGAEEAS